MSTTIGDFLSAARAGEPVYITEVRDAFLKLPPAASFGLDLAATGLGGGVRVFPLRLPVAAAPDEADFVGEFFLAELYNLLSSLGARAVTLHCPGHADRGEALERLFHDRFGVGQPATLRQGYGKCLNVLDRMLAALLPGASADERRFRLTVSDAPAPEESRPAAPMPADGAAGVFRRAAGDLAGKALLGVDIGGTDIKLVLAVDGAIVHCQEFDWNPAAMGTAEEFVEPIRLLHALMAWAGRAARDGDARLDGLLRPAFGRDATLETVKNALAAAAERFGPPGFLFDAVGLSFPDVVVANKIVGGETSKTRGMRERLGGGYDAEFEKLTHLDRLLASFVKPGGRVGIINDGPMAAFTAGVETAAIRPEETADGVFAHTLGTELGTGWVDETGAFPDIPLEVYNFIVDLGSYPERVFHPDDVRSLNNFNTRLPGTLQKYASQSGVFRLAFKHLPARRPDILRAILDRGFVVEGEGGLRIPAAPRDMRKPFLEFMMELAEREDDPQFQRIFEEIGVALAITGREVDRFLRPAARRRTLFGRLVKRAACFALMRRGAVACDPAADLAVADETMAETPLMRELGRNREYTVAQFAQAVGAVYFANYTLGRAGR